MNKNSYISNLPNNLTRAQKEAKWRKYQAKKTGRVVPKRKPTSVVPHHPIHTALAWLSQCAMGYAMALSDPFNLNKEVCIPDLHVVPSKKVRVVTRGTFSTGLNGSGFIMGCVQCKGNNEEPIQFSNATFNGATFTNTGTQRSFAQYAQLPYASSDFKGQSGASTLVSGRVVGYGLRIRYIGNKLGMGGQVIGYRQAQNGDINGLTFNQLRTFSHAKMQRVDGDWHCVSYIPVRPEEFEYSDYPNVALSAGLTPPVGGVFELGFAIEGTYNAAGALGPAPFEFEVYQHIEYLGQIDNVTQSHSDISSMSIIRNALPVSTVVKHPERAHLSLLQRVGTYIEDKGSQVANYLAKSVATPLTNRALANFSTKAISYAEKTLPTVFGTGVAALEEVL
jgi:hypothetical protein